MATRLMLLSQWGHITRSSLRSATRACMNSIATMPTIPIANSVNNTAGPLSANQAAAIEAAVVRLLREHVVEPISGRDIVAVGAVQVRGAIRWHQLQ